MWPSHMPPLLDEPVGPRIFSVLPNPDNRRNRAMESRAGRRFTLSPCVQHTESLAHYDATDVALILAINLVTRSLFQTATL